LKSLVRSHLVIARSASDEAIHALPNQILDCFASLAMTFYLITRHAPRKPGIQYAVTSVSLTTACFYWIIRWSLSSGGAPRRPGGG